MGVFDRVDVAGLRAGTGLKWHAHPDDVLPLWVAEMDIPTAPVVADAVAEAIRIGNTGYPHGHACAAGMADFAADRWGWTFDPTRTVAMADVMTGIREVLALVSGPGDPVVVTPPVYGPFMDVVELAGRTRVDAPLRADGRLDLEVLDAALARAAAAATTAAVLLLCSPHNPTGVVHTREELEATAALARRHGVRVVVDEIHAPLTLPGTTFVPWLSLDDTEVDLTVLSASKGWNLAALKAAVVVAGADAQADLDRTPELVRHGPSHMGLIAHTAALRHATDWLDDVRAGIAANHALLADLVAARLPGVDVLPAEATYLAWMNFRAADVGATPAATLLDEVRVALTGGDFFGQGGAHHARMNVATSPAVVREAVDRIAAVVSPQTMHDQA